MSLFDDVGPVQKELTIENMPLIDLYNKGVQDVEAFEASCNQATYDEMEATLNMVLKRFGEVPANAKGKLAGLPAAIPGMLASLKTLMASGSVYGSALPSVLASTAGGLKSTLYFAIGNL